MAIAEIIPAEPEHIAIIAADVRQADRREVWASSMRTPEQAMATALRFSDVAYSGRLDGELVCMWGVVPESLIGPIGVPWMLGTTGLEAGARTFLRHCRPAILRKLSRYRLLYNHVDARNTRSIRWLKWLGFTVENKAVLVGPWKMPFYRFEMRSDHV